MTKREKVFVVTAAQLEFIKIQTQTIPAIKGT